MTKNSNRKYEKRRVLYARVLLFLFLIGFAIKKLHHHENHLTSFSKTTYSESKVTEKCFICISNFSLFEGIPEFTLQLNPPNFYSCYIDYTMEEVVVEIQHCFLRGPPPFLL